MRSVVASTASTREMARIMPAKPPGLFGTFGTRAKVKATSSGVTGVPSCQVAFGRSFSSHIASPTGVQLAARPGVSSAVGVRSTSRS